MTSAATEPFSLPSARRALLRLHRELEACRACPKMVGPVVHGVPVVTRVLLIGQAPGPREGGFGRPFAWTAGKTLFRWFHEALGVDEAMVRERVYIAAVARCFPGKSAGGGDRKPDAGEIDRCRTFLEREVGLLRPSLVIPVGALAIEQVFGKKEPLAEVIGSTRKATYLGREVDVIALPHPSGASPWHKMEPGVTLLRRAMQAIAKHSVVVEAFADRSAHGEPCVE